MKIGADEDLEQAVAGAKAGAVLEIEGSHMVQLVLKRSLTLKGGEGARLEGVGGSIIKAEGKGTKLVLESLTLAGGDGELGGALLVHRDAQVTARRCRFDGNAASAKGGAIYVGSGELVAEDCAFVDNRAGQGGALHVEGLGRASLETCELSDNSASRGAGISVHDGATVSLVGVRGSGQSGDGVDLRVRGTTSRAPSVSVRGCVLAGGIDAHPEGTVREG
jgi:predicted outer membrane repeat protein